VPASDPFILIVVIPVTTNLPLAVDIMPIFPAKVLYLPGGVVNINSFDGQRITPQSDLS
jgi:hypothetical protein